MGGKIRGIAKPCKGNRLKDLRLGIVGKMKESLALGINTLILKKWD